MTDACFCSDDSISEDVDSCLVQNCPLSDQLEAKKFQASTCDFPRHDRRTTLDVVTYTLYAFAAAFTIAWITSKWLINGGASFGWNDSIALITSLPVSALMVSHWFKVHNGQGQDAWNLSPGQVANLLHVCSAIQALIYIVADYMRLVDVCLQVSLCRRRLWNQTITRLPLYACLERTGHASSYMLESCGMHPRGFRWARDFCWNSMSSRRKQLDFDRRRNSHLH